MQIWLLLVPFHGLPLIMFVKLLRRDKSAGRKWREKTVLFSLLNLKSLRKCFCISYVMFFLILKYLLSTHVEQEKAFSSLGEKWKSLWSRSWDAAFVAAKCLHQKKCDNYYIIGFRFYSFYVDYCVSKEIMAETSNSLNLWFEILFILQII